MPVKLKEALVALPEEQFFQLLPSEELCHWYFSPFPVAFTVNFTVAPALTVCALGWVVTPRTYSRTASV